MKISKKVFGVKLNLFELVVVLLGGILAIIVLLQGVNLLSISSYLGINQESINLMAIIFSVLTLGLIGFYFYKKDKNLIVFSTIIVLVLLLFANSYLPFATVFNPSGELGNIVSTQSECQGIEGVSIPLNQDCGYGMIEVGQSGENFICCLPDTCEGNWERVYNPETKIFEKMCR